jgi:hypothetical protein
MTTNLQAEKMRFFEFSPYWKFTLIGSVAIIPIMSSTDVFVMDKEIETAAFTGVKCGVLFLLWPVTLFVFGPPFFSKLVVENLKKKHIKG